MLSLIPHWSAYIFLKLWLCISKAWGHRKENGYLWTRKLILPRHWICWCLGLRVPNLKNHFMLSFSAWQAIVKVYHLFLFKDGLRFSKSFILLSVLDIRSFYMGPGLHFKNPARHLPSITSVLAVPEMDVQNLAKDRF